MVFNQESKQSRYSSKLMLDQAFPNFPYAENRYVNVEGERSPFDGDIAYWSKRNSKFYDGAALRAILTQHHRCGLCGLQLLSTEKVHLHHADGNHRNWKTYNLLSVHESCHDYVHMSKNDS